ncbi:riboflavin biosynthesis pyrimidine reductase [Isoptericola sp. CG 20/1183]|uniref:Riboflavin biosynthesis pyrimidine reductase n=1 Tax=Isoptericola halotolerans TaxID=300560 RepID=A0ABX5EAR4_9MICO|nr:MULTISPECIES: dihydrofolate reductase family protein [Isoptericola]MCK0115598.1 dihydrofolate reductase family protein [Isoptericola sp. S6320L]PRZ03798.1 riboflavin biosynthesis pyrimidine reductase [Isoptericola sp. CG 20/1183]PRZ04069.1 riboflavin biosynthesis pyrimidine reductase [Isoptericola halotolerans]
MSSDTPPLRLLVPDVEELPPDPREERLAALYALPAHTHVRVNMVASVDGGAWGDDGRSGSVNDAADWRVFRVLRALADVVLVGAGTARTESYTALERPRGLEHHSARPLELALVTRSGRVPARTLDGPRLPWVVTGTAGAATASAAVGEDRLVVVPEVGGAIDLEAGVVALAARGLGRVLCEGGPHLLGSMLEAGLVDELCVTTTPRLVGAGPGRIVGGPADEPRPARLARLLAAPSGTLLASWDLRHRAEAPVPTVP